MFTQHQKVLVVEEYLRDETCCPNANKQYSMIVGNDQRIAVAREQLDCCCRSCMCFCRRDFDIEVTDKDKKLQYVMTHGRICCSWFSCCACCRHRFSVRNANGEHIGKVEAECKLCCDCFPSFEVTDAKGDRAYRVAKDVNCCQGMFGTTCKCCGCNCVFPTGYSISGRGGNGSIDKVPDKREEDSYTVEFPKDATDADRLLLLGAAFLVDYALYDDHAKSDAYMPGAQVMK